MIKEIDINRFWSSIEICGEDDCWNWIKCIDTGGYGAFKFNGKKVNSNRFSLMIKLGRNITPGMFACHTCNNRRCCNPKHLYEGTPRQNIEDSIKSGTYALGRISAYGENTAMAKLSNKDVLSILDRLNHGESRAVLADEYHVSYFTMRDIQTGRSWSRITGRNGGSSN